MNEFNCRYCNSVRKNHNSWINHERCCPKNPDRNYKNGMTGKKGSNQYTKALLLGKETPKRSSKQMSNKSFLGKSHTAETKKITSEKRSLNNKGGRSKWYEVNGIKVQGTWERNVAEVLTKNNIVWIKPTTKDHSFKYLTMDGVLRTYCPDFYLQEYDLYLEIKGYWWGNDKEKIDLVISQNKDINLKIVEKIEYEKILRGELVW